MDGTEFISNPYVIFILAFLGVLIAIFGVWITFCYYNKNKKHQEIIETETQIQ